MSGSVNFCKSFPFSVSKADVNNKRSDRLKLIKRMLNNNNIKKLKRYLETYLFDDVYTGNLRAKRILYICIHLCLMWPTICVLSVEIELTKSQFCLIAFIWKQKSVAICEKDLFPSPDDRRISHEGTSNPSMSAFDVDVMWCDVMTDQLIDPEKKRLKIAQKRANELNILYVYNK